jgi:leader peptidase (prepilin peptidase)/N-methyltransferase
MEHLFISIVLAVIGLILGSYAAATVWRLRARQLVEDKQAGDEDVDMDEYNKLLPLTQTSVRKDRSRCLHCEHTLAWYDLLPLVSWLGLKGKCRYCHVRIGMFEPLMEIGMAVLFVGSFLLWPSSAHMNPLQLTEFIVWLVAGVMLVILFAYDMKWFLLPNQVIFPLIAVGMLMTLLHFVGVTDIAATFINLALGVVILSGIYLLLWLISKGRWIGFGDVKLGLALALLLGNWQLAFIALFAANLIGCLVVIPGMVAGKITRTSRVPFGPLLIVGAVLAMLWGPSITSWYFTIFM